MNPAATDPRTAPPHALQHTNANDAIQAIQAKVGVNASAVASSLDFLIKSLTGGHNHDGVNSRTASAASASLHGVFLRITAGQQVGSSQLFPAYDKEDFDTDAYHAPGAANITIPAGQGGTYIAYMGFDTSIFAGELSIMDLYVNGAAYVGPGGATSPASWQGNTTGAPIRDTPLHLVLPVVTVVGDVWSPRILGPTTNRSLVFGFFGMVKIG